MNKYIVMGGLLLLTTGLLSFGMDNVDSGDIQIWKKASRLEKKQRAGLKVKSLPFKKKYVYTEIANQKKIIEEKGEAYVAALEQMITYINEYSANRAQIAQYKARKSQFKNFHVTVSSGENITNITDKTVCTFDEVKGVPAAFKAIIAMNNVPQSNTNS